MGILDMQIYIRDNLLFMIVDTVDDFDWVKDNARLSKLPRQAEWEAYMSRFQQAAPQAPSAEKWKLMSRMFSLDALPETEKKKVFVSGCFDMLHSGHIAFFREAARYGDLYVGIGSDKTLFELKHKRTVCPEQERLFMVKSVRYVKEAWINRGDGILDFAGEFIKLKPDILFVNSDGDSPLKRELCQKYGVRYIVSERVPSCGLAARSTTALRKESFIPYRLDLAGGWLDQPYVNGHFAGPVITLCIEPDRDYNRRSGLSSSSRDAAMEMWGCRLPNDAPEKLAKMIFRYENPPGTRYVSGSQDAIGIVFPGLNLLEYDRSYWPYHIQSVTDTEILDFVERHIWLYPLKPRGGDYDVLADTHISRENAQHLSAAAYRCWDSIMRRDWRAWGKACTDSFEAQVVMFPNMADEAIRAAIEQNKAQAAGWKLSGAGGGGYIIYISEEPVKGAFQIHVKKH